MAGSAARDARPADAAALAKLLRSGEHGGGGEDVAFTPECIRALETLFAWFDTDADAALDFVEANAMFQSINGAPVSKEDFASLVDLVDHDVHGNITFAGLVKLYKLDYEEQGEALGDLNVWNDLSKFGFDETLQHNGQFPARATKAPNAFKLLGKPASSGSKPTQQAATTTSSDTTLAAPSAAVEPLGDTTATHSHPATGCQNGKAVNAFALLGGKPDPSPAAPTKACKKASSSSKSKGRRPTPSKTAATSAPSKTAATSAPSKTAATPAPSKTAATPAPSKTAATPAPAATSAPSKTAATPASHEENAQAPSSVSDVEVVDITDCEEKTIPRGPATSATKRKSAFDVLGQKASNPKKSAKLAAKQGQRARQDAAPDGSVEPPRQPFKRARAPSDGPVDPFFQPRSRPAPRADSPGEELSQLPAKFWSLPTFPPADITHVGYEASADTGAPLPWKRDYLDSGPTEGLPWAFSRDPSWASVTPLLHCGRQVRVFEFAAGGNTSVESFLDQIKASELGPRAQEADQEALREFAVLRLDGANDKPWDTVYRPGYAKLLYDGTDAASSLREWLETWSADHHSAEALALDATADASHSSFLSGSFLGGSMDGLDDEELNGPATSSMPVHLIVGETGLGKSNLALHVADQLGFLVTEVHAGMLRSASHLKTAIGEATQSCAIGRSRRLDKSLILIDEVDIVFDEDKQFFAGIKALVDNARCPIIFTCNRVPHEFLRIFPDRVVEHPISTSTLGPLFKALDLIALVQGIDASTAQLFALLGMFNNKLCRALHQLQFCCGSRVVPARVGTPHVADDDVVDITTPQKPACSAASAEDDDVVTVCEQPRVVTLDLFPASSNARAALEGAQGYPNERMKLVLQVKEHALKAATTVPCRREHCRFHLADYAEEPLIEGLVPGIGTLQGGTQVQIRGMHLAPADAEEIIAEVDGRRCEILSVSPTCIVARTPPGVSIVESPSGAAIKSVDASALRSDVSDEDEDSEDSDFEDTKPKKSSLRLRKGRQKTRVPKRRRVVASTQGANADSDDEDDDIEESDDNQDALGSSQAQSPDDPGQEPLREKKLLRKLRPFDRLTLSRLWPVDVHVTVRLPKMVLATSQARPRRCHNGFFEYSTLVDPTQAQLAICGGETPAGSEAMPSLKSCATDCGWADSMEALSALADWGSWCDILETRAGPRDATRAAVEESRDYEGMPADSGDVELDAVQAHIVASYESLGASVHSGAQLDVTGVSNMTERGLAQRRALFMKSARRCAEDALTPFSIGAARGLGFANSRRVQHAVLDEIGCLSRIAWLEEGRKAVDRSRRGFRHYMDNRGLAHVKEAAHNHLESFLLWSR